MSIVFRSRLMLRHLSMLLGNAKVARLTRLDLSTRKGHDAIDETLDALTQR